MSPMNDLGLVLATSLRLAREAADAILGVRRGGALNVSEKGVDDPVCAADHAANAILTAGLMRALPSAVMVSEENDPATYASYRDAEYAYFVDPLDGTKDFIRGGSDFCVMIGLVERGIPVLGVIVSPISGDAAFSTRGNGAWLETKDGSKRALKLPESPRELKDATLLTSSSHLTDEVAARLKHLGASALVPRGSVGVKAMTVCAGDADGYVHPTRMAGRRWDVAGPEAIVREAGGRLCDGEGNAFDYRGPSLDNAGIICGPSALIDQVLARLLDLSGSGSRS